MFGADDVRVRARGLAALEPSALVAWAIETFRGRIALTISLNAGGIVLAHMVSLVDRGGGVPLIFLDTGYHFPETLAFRDQVAERFGLHVLTVVPASDPGPLYETDANRCCAIRKVEPMQRAIRPFDAWLSAVRRDQTPARAHADVVECHDVDGHPVVKVLPLVSWSRDDVSRYVRKHGLPEHPLSARGYASIGCRPCTRAIVDGEGERAGRWSGTGKVECGLHTFTKRGD